MYGYLRLVAAVLVAGFCDAQTLSTSPIDSYTALVPVNINCVTDPIKGLVCAAEYPDQCKEQWNFPNPCTPQNLDMNVTKFIHPFDTTKFLMCGELGKLYVVQCPKNEVFHEGCGQCVGKGTGFDASCEVPLTSMINNPCTAESILANQLFFPFPQNLSKFIHCDAWGKAWERTCTIDQVWSQHEVACVPPSSLNPCTRPTVDVNFLYKHPCDPYKYIQCSASVAYEVSCPPGRLFTEARQDCQPLGTLSFPPKFCGSHLFGFRVYSEPSITGKVDQGNVNIGGNAGGTGRRNPFNSLLESWKSSVTGSDTLTGTGTATTGSGGTDPFGTNTIGGSGTSGVSGSFGMGATTGSGTSGFSDTFGTGTGGASDSFGIGTGGATNTFGTGTGGATDSFGTGTGGATDPFGTGTGGATDPFGTGTGGATNSFGSGSATGSMSGGATDMFGISSGAGSAGTMSGQGVKKPGIGKIHSSQTKEYDYSTIRWAEPCTQDNIMNERFHFKLRSNPHRYIQCDAHGTMYNMPCSQDGVKADWFDVYTSTCVDGPVHLPSEQLAGMPTRRKPLTRQAFLL